VLARKMWKSAPGLPSTSSLAAAKRPAPGESQLNRKKMTALPTKEINLRLKAVRGWAKRGKTISRSFQFDDFLHSLGFVNRVAKKAQTLLNHHPDIDIRYDKVTLTLTTHDEGGLTKKDFTLAEQCNAVFARLLAA